MTAAFFWSHKTMRDGRVTCGDEQVTDDGAHQAAQGKRVMLYRGCVGALICEQSNRHLLRDDLRRLEGLDCVKQRVPHVFLDLQSDSKCHLRTLC